MRKLTFAKEELPEYEAFIRKFGRDAMCPEGVPYPLSVEARFWKSIRWCKEFCAFLGQCIKRNKPPTEKGYIDYFYLDEDGVYRGGLPFEQKDTRDYKEFVKIHKALEGKVLF